MTLNPPEHSIQPLIAQQLTNAYECNVIEMSTKLYNILCLIGDGLSIPMPFEDIDLCHTLCRSPAMLERYIDDTADGFPYESQYIFDVALYDPKIGRPKDLEYIMVFESMAEVAHRYKSVSDDGGDLLERLERIDDHTHAFSVRVSAIYAPAQHAAHYETTYVFTIRYVDADDYVKKIIHTYQPETWETAHSVLCRLHAYLPMTKILSPVIDEMTEDEMDMILDDILPEELNLQASPLKNLLCTYMDPSTSTADKGNILIRINQNPGYRKSLKQLKRSVSRLTTMLKNTKRGEFTLMILDTESDIDNQTITFLDYDVASPTLEIVNKITCKRIERNDFAGRTHITCCITGEKIPNASEVWVTINLFSDQVDCRHTFTCMISIEQLFDLMQLLCDTEESLENNLFRSGLDDPASGDTESGYGYTTEQ